MTNKAYGAILVTTLRALNKEGTLNTANYPALETLLAAAADVGDAANCVGCESDYADVYKAIGWRLFRNKSAEEKALEDARVEEWKAGLDKKASKALEKNDDDDDDDDDDEDDDKENPWWKDGKNFNENVRNTDFTLSRIWPEYREVVRGSPSMPMMGGHDWDISKWSREERAPFEFANMAV
jgi:hypothetical protein